MQESVVSNLHDYRLHLNGNVETSENRTPLVRKAAKAAKNGVSVTPDSFEHRVAGEWRPDEKAAEMYQAELKKSAGKSSRVRNDDPKTASLRELARLSSLYSKHANELTSENISVLHSAIGKVHAHYPADNKVLRSSSKEEEKEVSRK